MELYDIFSAIASHMIKGMMVHEQLMNSYQFLGLAGYATCHEYHYISESKGYADLCKYAIEHFSFICTASKVDDPGIIPNSWRESVRESVTKEVRSKALRSALQEWINWEMETVKLYSGFYTKLISMEEIPAADFVEHYILDAEKEATFAKDELNKKMAIDFDIVSIMEEQEEFESIYKKKLRKVYKEGDLYGNS